MATPFELRALRSQELRAASALCLRSKAYWGYDDAFMAACKSELTLTEADLAEGHLIAAFDPYGLAGIAQISVAPSETHLEKLFVETDRIGSGLGRILFDWAATAARKASAQEMIIEADPDAAPFYEHMGCLRAGDAPSGSVAGRVLPRFVYPL